MMAVAGNGLSWALGVRFKDQTGQKLGVGANYLDQIAKIDCR